MPSGADTIHELAFRDMENLKAQENVQEFRLPEWETTARHRGETQVQTGQKSGVKERVSLVFDRFMPAHRMYFGFRRKIACVAILVVLLILLALILGLAIGLSRKSRYASAPAKNLDTTHLTSCLATIKVSLWDHTLTQAISPTTVLDSVPAASPPQTPTTSYPLVTLPSILYPKAQIRMLIRCAGTN